MAKKTNYIAMPSDFQKKIDNLGQVVDDGYSKCPALFYQSQQIRLPLSAAGFNKVFGATMNLFASNPDEPCEGTQTNLTLGANFTVPFLAVGFSIVVTGEGKAGTLFGVVVDRPASTSETTPCVGGCAMDGDDPQINASINYGAATWDVIEKFAQTYRLQMTLCRRYLAVDEPLTNLISVMSNSQFCGGVNSLLPGMKVIQETNENMKCAGIDKVFLHQNNAGSACVGGPSMGASFGNPCMGGTLGMKRFFCFPQAYMFWPGMAVNMQLVEVEDNSILRAQLRRAAVYEPSESQTDDPIFGAPVDCGTGLSAAVHEIPSGTINISYIIWGYEMNTCACLDMLANLGVNNPLFGALKGNAYVAGLVGSMSREQLAGNSALAGLAGAASVGQ